MTKERIIKCGTVLMLPINSMPVSIIAKYDCEQ